MNKNLTMDQQALEAFNALQNGTSTEITVDIMARFIDHTLLKPEATKEQIESLANDCRHFNFKSICVNSCWVEYVSSLLEGMDTAVCAVVGFPLGAMAALAKAYEAETAVKAGAGEIDMVMNIGAMLSGDYSFVESDILSVRKAIGPETVLKVIIETCLLNESQKIQACNIAQQTAADFVKTSTGFSTGGAAVEDVTLMRQTVGPDMGVKASGGIRTWDSAMAMLHAGANRLGMGASLEVLAGMGKSNG